MTIDWNNVEADLVPIKNYDDLCKRLQRSFSYPFIGEAFDFSIQALLDYTQRLLGGDTRDRYKEYEIKITQALIKLVRAGCESVLDLIRQTSSRERLEKFIDQVDIPAGDIIRVLKYLVYWFIPGEKYLSGLVYSGSSLSESIKALAEYGIRTNLQLLQQGITSEERKSLSNKTGLSFNEITQLVHLADFSRMPWASKATISNIIEAGYPSIAKLAMADPEQLYKDFFRYGNSIGKNLKLGNEIENSHRIAKIIPVLLKNDDPL
jgi:hypothetical protein